MAEAVGAHALGRGDRVRARVRAKIAEVDAKLARLTEVRAQLEALAACRCRQDCPVIASVLAGASSRPAEGR